MNDELPAGCREMQQFLRDSMFEIAVEELIRLAGGQVADIASCKRAA
ncbi:MAG: hypothetical protein FWF31_11400 [Desulfobulbus sp.]|nr:hypothetical protein [Desulfobulbus sp.]